MKYMKRNLNNKGFGKKEIMFVLVFMLVIMAIYFTVLNGKIGGADTKAMKALADNFYNDATIYKDEYPTDDDVYYAYDLATSDKGYSYMDPNNKDETCDYFESFVKIRSQNELQLKCGKYVVEWKKNEKYRVYEVGEWTTEEVTGDGIMLYNYKLDGKLQLEKPVVERAFTQKLQMAVGEELMNMEDVNYYIKNHPDKKLEVVSEMYYRSKKLVAEY